MMQPAKAPLLTKRRILPTGRGEGIPQRGTGKRGRVAAADFPDRLIGVHRISAQSGWTYGMALWRTEDGGGHWRMLSAPSLQKGPIKPAYIGSDSC